jgi:hypothetical protein
MHPIVGRIERSEIHLPGPDTGKLMADFTAVNPLYGTT